MTIRREINLILLLCISSTFPIIASPAQTPVISTDSSRLEVEITVYNNNIGLVKDVRKIRLPQGIGELRFMDIASAIMPVTVRAISLSNQDDFRVLEQNYEYDLMSADKLLDKYVGKKIRLIDNNEYKDKKEELEAVLLSNNDGQIYKINNQIYLGHPGLRILPSIPENLIANPTLMWMFESRRTTEQNIEISYLTGDIGWTADYILVLNKDDTRSGLTGWVSIDNRSGAAYDNAKLTLVAGNVNMVSNRRAELMQIKRQSKALMADAAPQFQETEFFEYHVYNLQRPATVKNNQTKQIQLLQAPDFEITKELLTGSFNAAGGGRQYDGMKKQPVEVFVKFKNSEKNSLGMPFPAGIIRVYKKDAGGSQQFVGEDRIEHTPKNEDVKLKIGEAFDIVAERVQKSYNEIGSRAYEAEWEITIKNHKKNAVTIGVVEKLNGDWKIVAKSQPYEKVDAFTIRFNANVPAEGETKVSYQVKVQW